MVNCARCSALPWVRASCLASRLLSLAARRGTGTRDAGGVPQVPARPALTEEAADAFLNGRDPTEACYDGDGIAELRRRVADRAPSAELDHHLSSSRDGNTRNGHHRKTAHAERGSLPLDVPRDRRGTFRLQLVEPWCRRLPPSGS